jgi:endogenous inhibitor of DNA gyrase (YacG/DUF329 family)
MTPPSLKKPDLPLRVVRTEAKCPVCSRPGDAKYRPFCTKRCADIDLGRWLKESYRVPTDEGLEEAEGTPELGPGRQSGQDG